MNKRQIAQIVHETIKAYKEQIGESEVSWEISTKEVKDATIAGVESVMNNGSVTPESWHKMWCAYKTGEGWLYGPEKSDQLKLHPRLVSFDKLPEAGKIQDALFINTVKALLPALDTLGG